MFDRFGERISMIKFECVRFVVFAYLVVSKQEG